MDFLLLNLKIIMESLVKLNKIMSHPTTQEFLEYWTEFYVNQGIDLERAIELAEKEFDKWD